MEKWWTGRSCTNKSLKAFSVQYLFCHCSHPIRIHCQNKGAVNGCRPKLPDPADLDGIMHCCWYGEYESGENSILSPQSSFKCFWSNGMDELLHTEVTLRGFFLLLAAILISWVRFVLHSQYTVFPHRVFPLLFSCRSAILTASLKTYILIWHISRKSKYTFCFDIFQLVLKHVN